ncbi:MAG: S8 family serine peptidase [Candidatus Heimdallarchaeota archaeon]|nr:S8 family serine peptidase [Candidatus Heimdallarchaeota archaeon]
MKQGKILCISLLSLLLFSMVGPFVLAQTDFPEKQFVDETKIYQQPLIDRNGDKIDDGLMLELNELSTYSLDLVVKFNHRVSYLDRCRLADLGAQSFETWDRNQRVLIHAPKAVINDITKLPNVEFITKAEIRLIVVAIAGEDFSDLNALEQFAGSEIFWHTGCALVPYYSGIENDIKQLGDYTVISDVTDIRYHPQVESSTGNDLSTHTVDTAETINATALWDMGFLGGGIKVGNIDTGIHDTHPDIQGRVIKAKSFVLTEYGYDQDDPETDDPNGHGSHTTGIIAGSGQTNPANKGIAPQASIIFAKIGGSATLISMIAALDWVADQDVDVINLSYGGGDQPGDDPVEIAFKNVVRNDGVLCSISAGNEGAEGYYTAGSPGTADDVITVANLDDTVSPPEIAYSSSRGPSADDHMKPDVAAPGTQIVSMANGGNGYATMSGTSMAAPHVTGAIALLIQALKSDGISNPNPGLIKAALIASAELLSTTTYPTLFQGAGYINVGQALHLIRNAPKAGDMPIVGACNPVQQPLFWWEEMRQGQLTEQYLTCVSPFEGTNLTVEATGDVAEFITIGPIANEWTSPTKITYEISDDAPLGSYTGQLQFKYNDIVMDTVDVEIDVKTGNGHKMLLNYRTTNYGIDHLYGQFRHWVEDILENEYIINEQNIMLDNLTYLSKYDAIWLPDPFNYEFPEALEGDFETITTYNALTQAEIDTLHDFVDAGGSLFLCFLGLLEHQPDADNPVYYVYGNNVTHINLLTDIYGIHVRDSIWTSANTIAVDITTEHPISAEVSKTDHYGTSLEVSGDAVGITQLTAGSDYTTLAATQTEAGGRVIVWGTNFALDTEGYQNKYNTGLTQNDVLGMNLFRWATATHRIRQTNLVYGDNDTSVTMTYEYLSGPGPDFGGHVKLPDGNTTALNWTQSGDEWTSTFTCTMEGEHHFYPECGETGIDDFGYFSFTPNITAPPTTGPTTSETGASSIAPIIAILIGCFGLASWHLLQRKRH